MQKYQKKPKSTNNKSFSIVELTIVLLIISIITTTSVSLYSSKIEVENIKSTKVKMAVIYEAIKAFVKTHKRMPCPADPALGTSDSDPKNFGEEDFGEGGECNIEYRYISTDNEVKIYQGAVPVYALGLSSEMIKDDFGYKFSYVMIDGHQNAFDYNDIGKSLSEIEDSFEYTAGEDSAINLTSGSNDHIENPAFLLISHGKNGYGAYNYNGHPELSTPQQEDENDTKHEEHNYQYNNGSSTEPNITNQFYYDGNLAFDDIVFFKTKNNLIMDIDWQEKLCATPVCISNEDEVYEEDNEELNASYCYENPNSVYEYKLDIISKPGDSAEVKKFTYDAEGISTVESCTEDLGFIYKATCGKYGIWNISATKKICGSVGGYMIAMWSGKKDKMPLDWSVCDGTADDGSDDEPDLRNRFIVGAGLESDSVGIYETPTDTNDSLICTNDNDVNVNNCYKVSEIGGEDKHALKVNELAIHSHGAGGLRYSWRDENGGNENGETSDGKVDVDSDGDTSSDISRSGLITGTTAETGSGDAHENRPPYYALYFICKKLEY